MKKKGSNSYYTDKSSYADIPSAELYISAKVLIGLSLVVGGFLLLGNLLGFISLSIWGYLWKFWPSILIILGLQIILGKSLLSQSIVISIGIIFLICSTTLSYIAINHNIKEAAVNHLKAAFKTTVIPVTTTIQKIPLSVSNIQEKSITFNLDKADIHIADGENSDMVIDSSTIHKTQIPQIKTYTKDTVLNTTVDISNNPSFPFSLFSQEKPHKITIGAIDIPTTIIFNIKRSNTTITLSQTKIKAFQLQARDSKYSMKILRNSLPIEKSTITVRNSIGTFLIPKDAGVKIHYSVKNATFKISDSMISGSGVYQSATYDENSSTAEIELHVDGGNGKLIFF